MYNATMNKKLNKKRSTLLDTENLLKTTKDDLESAEMSKKSLED